MFRKLFLFLFLSLCFLFLQSSLLKLSYPGLIVPDGLVVLSVYLGLYFRNPLGLLCAFLLGLLADSASAAYLGPHAAGAVVAFYLSGLLSSRMYADRALAIMFVAGVCVLAKVLTYLSLLSFYTGVSLFGEAFASGALLEVLFSALFAPLIFKILSWFSFSSVKDSRYGVSNSDRKVSRSFLYRSL